jgi:prevent-host-death family protein
VDVAVTELRARLSVWLDLVRHGEEVVITDRGLPVARLLGMESTPTLARLTDEGVIARPVSAQRPKAAGRQRPRPRVPIADIVSEQRD